METRALFLVSEHRPDAARLAALIGSHVRLTRVDGLSGLPQLVGRRAWLALPASLADAEAERVRRLRGAWRIILIYDPACLLEASDWFGFVETWSEASLLERMPEEILTVAEAGYSVWPRGVGIEDGLTPLRCARLDRLSPLDRSVLDALGEGVTNRSIAARLGVSERTVMDSLRRSMRVLHVQRRLQAALIAARGGKKKRARTRRRKRDPDRTADKG